MPRSAARRLSSPERRALIEQAATRLFARKGFVATTVEDIVKASGVTNPMLYRFFESKEELCVSLLRRYRDELAAAPLDEFIRGDPRAESRLEAMIDAWLAHIERDPDAARLLLKPIAGNSEVERVQRELHARQRAADVALIREFAPDLPEDEAEPLGEIIRASLAAVALWWLDHPDQLSREVPARALLRVSEALLSNVPSRKAGGV